MADVADGWGRSDDGPVEPFPALCARQVPIRHRLLCERDPAAVRRGKTRYLAGDDYTIADIASYAWMRIWKSQGISIEEYPNARRWLEELGERPAVRKGLGELAEYRSSGPPQGKAWEVMFGKEQFKRR